MADDTPTDGRRTAPQGPYGFAHVRVGIIVFVLGALLAFGIPMLAL